MNEQKKLKMQQWILVWALSTLLAIGLAGCSKSPTSTPPPAPVTDPAGEITMLVDKKISVLASALGADGYRWKLQGDGEISGTEGDTILYTVPASDQVDPEGTMALLTAAAYNEGGESPQTSLVINVVHPSICPPTDAEGTVLPSVTISSTTFIVNGDERVADDSGSFQVSPGDQVRVKDVTICVDPFNGRGGKVYVEFDPVKPDPTDPGEIIIIKEEVKGTLAVSVKPKLTTIPGPNYTWTIGDDWKHISVVTVHYPAEKTENSECEPKDPYICEVDDRMIAPVQ
jgi:hypothetical protein